MPTQIVYSQAKQEDAGQPFAIAEGLELTDATTADLVHWPVVADWDRQGRLVVVESGGVGWPIEEHNEKRLHQIVRLIDTDSDGVFDKRVLAAKDLPFTEGILCLEDSILVTAPPNILRLVDADGDGVCESREVWFDGQTLTACANDLHGPYLGYDGWVYWCKGAFGEQTHEQIDGTTVHDKAAHVYRRRMSGGKIESVVSGGMDNPVEVAFSAAGDLFFDSTFLQHPRDGKRDGIAHGVYGAVFGKDHSVLESLRRTGSLFPIMKHLGAAAPSGLLRLGHHSRVLKEFPSGYDLVVAEFNLHRVSVHTLSPSRATFRAESQVLLSSDRVDFHPTDVIEDGSGGLLVIDTGGWYDLCCPTSRVNQKVAGGGIYRLARNEAQQLGPQPWPEEFSKLPIDWQGLSVDECIQLFRDPRPWVQRGAVMRVSAFENAACLPLSKSLLLPELQAQRGREGNEFALIEPVPKGFNPRRASDLQQCQLALQAMSMIGTPEALAILTRKLDGSQDWKAADQELAILQVLSLHRYEAAEARFRERLSSRSLRVSRAAAEALGRLGTKGNSEWIVKTCAAATQWNPTLKHSVLFALMELNETEILLKILESDNSDQQQIAMAALHRLNCNQRQFTALKNFVFEAAFAKGTALRVAAREILLARPEWATGSVTFLERFRSDDLTKARFDELVQSWRSSEEVADYVAGLISDPQNGSSYLPLLSYWSLDPPRPIVDAAQRAIIADVDEVSQWIQTFELDPAAHSSLIDVLKNAASRVERFGTFKNLLAALPADVRLKLPSDVQQNWFERLFAEEEFELLSKLEMDASHLELSLEKLQQISAGRLGDFVDWIASQQSDALDKQLMQRLADLPAARMLDENVLLNAYQDRASEIRTEAVALNARLHQVPDDVQQEIQSVLARLPHGNAVNGLQVFRGSKASCSACHRIGYFGGEVGPELTHIGKTRTREALLEAILFPSQRIEQGYRPMRVLTEDGQVYSGIESVEQGRIRLQLNAEKSILLDPDVVEQKLPSDVSIMPGGIRDQITEQELADLLALLEAAR